MRKQRWAPWEGVRTSVLLGIAVSFHVVVALEARHLVAIVWQQLVRIALLVIIDSGKVLYGDGKEKSVALHGRRHTWVIGWVVSAALSWSSESCGCDRWSSHGE